MLGRNIRHKALTTGKTIQVRFESSSVGGPKPPFQSFKSKDLQDKKHVTFDRNMPSYNKPKAWERDGENKDEWFKRKHAHHHAAQKPFRENSNRRYEGIERKNRMERREEFEKRDQQRKHWEELRELRKNPQVDYVFGTNSVLAALKGQKRSSFGKIYMYNPKDTEKVNEILSLAKELKVKVTETTKQDLNQLTDNAVHNGIVLKTRPLEINSISALTLSSRESFDVKPERNMVLGTQEPDETIHLTSYRKRFPLGLYLDEITDPHNIGAILRSAYFLGVDFIVFSERNCASLTPVVSKTSSGALEFSTIFKVSQPLSFIEKSKENGWKVISTVSPTDKRNKTKKIDTSSISNMLENEPVLLIIGSEGVGIRTNLIDRSDHVVSVGSGREMNSCVDSLNVSVATALLVSQVLQE